MVVNRRPAVLHHYPWQLTSTSPPSPPNPSFSPIPFTAPSPPSTSLSPTSTTSTSSTSWVPLVSSRRSPPWSPTSFLDHLKTAIGTPIGGNVAGVVDMNRSGATIAFDYFGDKIDAANKAAVARFDGVRRLFEYIEDADLWRWKLPNSKAFSSGFKDLNLQYDVGLNPSLFQHLLSLDLESLISEGMASLSESRN